MSAAPPATAREPNLARRYREAAVPALTKEFDYVNVMEVPRVSKVIVNIGIGEAKDNAKALESAVADVRTITGQQPVVVKARKSVAAFKLRAGMPVGIRATLRGRRMWYFLEKLVTVALPRIRDFRGSAPTGSTAAATTRSGCASRSSSPRSTTTRSTSCAASRCRS